MTSIARWCRSKRFRIVGGRSLLLWAAIVHALLLNNVSRAWLESLHALPARPILVATLVHGIITSLLAVAATGRGGSIGPAAA
jgi:hypothetical protein